MSQQPKPSGQMSAVVVLEQTGPVEKEEHVRDVVAMACFVVVAMYISLFVRAGLESVEEMELPLLLLMVQVVLNLSAMRLVTPQSRLMFLERLITKD